MNGTRCYVYGVVPAGTALPDVDQTIGGAPLELVEHRRLAAVVGAVEGDWVDGTRANLLAHSAVLDRLVADGVTVLPMRFGVLADDRAAVVDTLLDGERRHLTRLLKDLTGRAEVRLQARYLPDVAVRDAAAAVPGIRTLQAQIRRGSEAATYFQRIRVGELIAEGVGDVQRRDAAAVLTRLAPLAVRHVELATPSDDVAVRAGFLVDLDRLEAFGAAVDELAAEQAHRLRCRVVGPLPAWDFVSLGGDERDRRRTGTR